MTVKLIRVTKRQRKLKRLPAANDIFRLRLEDGRWFLGRAILTDMPAMPGGESEDLVLIYLFRTAYEAAGALPDRLPVSELLCAPMLVGDDMWQEGFFEHVDNRECEEGERLPKHCLLYEPRGKYFDEYGQELVEPHAPIGEYGITSDAGVEEAITEGLGETENGHIPESRGVMMPLSPGTLPAAAEDAVVLFIPAPEDGESRGLDEIEDPLIDAVEEKGVGEWEGHGFDADLREWDIRFIGRSPKKIAEAMLPVLKTLALPPGCYLVVGGKRPTRIDL